MCVVRMGHGKETWRMGGGRATGRDEEREGGSEEDGWGTEDSGASTHFHNATSSKTVPFVIEVGTNRIVPLAAIIIAVGVTSSTSALPISTAAGPPATCTAIPVAAEEHTAHSSRSASGEARSSSS